MRLVVWAMAIGLAIAGCEKTSSAPTSARTPSAVFQPGPTVADPTFLNSGTWDDGNAEVAFYSAKLDGHVFDIGTYFLKHDFDIDLQTKAETGGVPAFKWALFFETERGSEQFKLSYIMNSAKADLAPLKLSVNSFDWCANQYQELAFTLDKKITRLKRSDDYGNEVKTFDQRNKSYPVAMMPLLVRALDFTKAKKVAFEVIENNARFIDAEAELVGLEKITTPYGEVDAEKIHVSYEDRVSWYFGDRQTRGETYWRGTDPVRTLIRVQEDGGRYEMNLVETIRSAYWNENVFDRLKRVTKHP